MKNISKISKYSVLNVAGSTIFFRVVEVEDARFIYDLRMNDKYNKYLSKVSEGLNSQVEWINQYKKREDNQEEYYYIIYRKNDALPIGTVRLYDYIENNKSFCWGSWILNENKTKYSALESALLIYDLAFFELGFEKCHMNIRKDNEKVIEFHKRFGVKIIGETNLDLLGVYLKEHYVKYRKELISFLESKDIYIK